LTDNYKGNFDLPIVDIENSYDDELMITELVYLLNNIHEQNVLNKKIIKSLIKIIEKEKLI